VFIFSQKPKEQPCELNSAFAKLTEVAPVVLQSLNCNKNLRSITELSSTLLYHILVKSYPQDNSLKIPGISFKKPSPGEAGARRKAQKTRNDQTGGIFWLKSEPILEKIRKTPDAGSPAASQRIPPSAGPTRGKNFAGP
jgi:hypothetical protein